MIFSSLLFLCVFLPLFLFIYFNGNNVGMQNRTLLIFSLIFYCFGGVHYLLLLLLMTAIGFFAGRLITRRTSSSERKPLLILSVAVFLSVLGIFKYIRILFPGMESLPGSSGFFLQLALPMGISFYTFKLISYIADLYSGTCEPAETYTDLLLYTSIFHQSIAGPIERYGDMASQFRLRKATLKNLVEGLTRFSVGLGKKVLLADHCGALVSSLLPFSANIRSVPVTGLWLGSICFMLQIYLDLSAYSDMAIGLGQMTGFHYKENFHYPYTAVSVTDFWKRWHISLSAFFRDYVYIPLGGNHLSESRMFLNLMIVWILFGFWHGPGWNYLIWGLFFFVCILLENHFRFSGKMSPVLGHIYTLIIVFAGWIIFRFENLGQLGSVLKGLIGLNGNSFSNTAVRIILLNNILFLILAVLACTPIIADLATGMNKKLRRNPSDIGKAMLLRILICFLLIILSIISLVGNSTVPFLYTRF